MAYPAPPTTQGLYRAPGTLQAPPSFGARGPPAAPPSPSVPSHPLALESQASGSVSLLRLQIADAYRIEPPVVVGAALASSSSSNGGLQAPMDLALERRLVAEADRSSSSSSSGLSAPAKDVIDTFLASVDPVSFLDPSVLQYAKSGIDKPALSLGLAYCSSQRLSKDKAIDFASNLTSLTEMGFRTARAAGALITARNDLAVAADIATAL